MQKAMIPVLTPEERGSSSWAKLIYAPYSVPYASQRETCPLKKKKIVTPC